MCTEAAVNRLFGTLSVTAAALGFIASPASAARITVDSDDYAVGTNLTAALNDVQVSLLRQGGSSGYAPTRSDVYTFECTDSRCAYNAGPTAFASSNDLYYFEQCAETGRPTPCGAGWQVVEFILGSTTDFFEISFGWLSDGPGVIFYDVNDNLIDQCFLPFGSPLWSCGAVTYVGDYMSSGSSSMVMSLQLDEARISRVVAGGVITPVTVNSFSYNVPAPGPSGLFVFGLVILGLRRRLAA